MLHLKSSHTFQHITELQLYCICASLYCKATVLMHCDAVLLLLSFNELQLYTSLYCKCRVVLPCTAAILLSTEVLLQCTAVIFSFYSDLPIGRQYIPFGMHHISSFLNEVMWELGVIDWFRPQCVPSIIPQDSAMTQQTFVFYQLWQINK